MAYSRRYGDTADFIDEGIDSGPIIVRKRYPIPKVTSHLELLLSECFMISDIAYHAVKSLSDELELTPNENGKYYHSIHPILSKISFAFQILN